jgi:fluoride exporter
VTAGYWMVVAAGGAFGALGRAALTLWVVPMGYFPLATFLINFIGSLVIGMAWSYFSRSGGHGLLSAFLMTGVLGGFTTFSTFSLETVQLIQQGAWGWAASYLVLSVLCCLLGVGLGIWLLR